MFTYDRYVWGKNTFAAKTACEWYVIIKQSIFLSYPMTSLPYRSTVNRMEEKQP